MSWRGLLTAGTWLSLVVAGPLNFGCDPAGQNPQPPAGKAPSPEPRPPQPLAQEPAPAASAPVANEQPPTPQASEQPPAQINVPAKKPLPDDYLGFDHACAEGPQVTIAAIGDILLHQELQRQAHASKLGHRVLWQGVEDLLRQADITYGNLEGVMAAGVDRKGNLVPDPGRTYDGKVYTAYPKFNYHPRLAGELVASGFDVVSTANNHSLDRRAIGVDKTIAELKKAKLRFTGTRTQTGEGEWWTKTTANGINIAWLACTITTNQIPDDLHQVLHCHKDTEEIVGLVRKLARRKGIDAVVVTPHWGRQYTPEPRNKQKKFAYKLAEAGATAVIGSHPHVTQPWERYRTKDDREVFIHYSLGNFVSHQPELPRRTTLILYVTFRRLPDRTVVAGVGYVPVHVRQQDEVFFAEAIDRVGGPADARELLTQMYGTGNLLAADAGLNTTPQCAKNQHSQAPAQQP